MTYPTTEQVEKARQASLADFFIQNGFEAELTKKELHVKGYGGLYINTDTNEWYCFLQADKHGGRYAVLTSTEILFQTTYIFTAVCFPECTNKHTTRYTRRCTTAARLSA